MGKGNILSTGLLQNKSIDGKEQLFRYINANDDCVIYWCRRGDLNPHPFWGPAPKAGVSTISPPRH